MQRISITNPQNIIDGTAKKYYFKLRNTGGPKGDKGEKGDTGATGPQGPQGNAATVSVGSTTTLPVGYDATVTNTGSIYNAVLDFGIPQGPQGPQGAKGDKGDTGAKGDTGPRGPQGERGTNATVYVGTTTTTNPGTQARVYNSGTDSNAVLNFEIPRGDVGPMPTIAQTTGQSTTEVMSQKATTDALNTKQNALTAGQGIDITSDVISTPALVPEVVASLPAEGAEGKLYLTPKAHTTQTATGNPITASVTEQAGTLESFQLDGDTFQQTYTGQNLYNVATLQTGANVTKDDDGWITVTRDNSSGSSTSYTNIWTDNLDLETSTQYAIVVEIKAASGTGELDITSTNATQGQFSSWQSRQVASLAAGQVFKVTPTTKSSFSGIYGGLRTILNLKAGQSASVTFRLSVLADASVGPSGFVYEPYVGGQASPNPDYPQPIQTVAGEQTVEIQGKNLFNKDKALDKYFYTSTGSKSTYSKAQFYNNNFVPTSDKITMSYSAVHDRQSGSIIEANVRIVQYDASGNFISRLMSRTNGYTFTLDANTKSFILCIDNGPDAWFDDLQVEYGPTATAYTPYSKQTLPLDLGSIELCKLGTYQDYIYKDGENWKVHKVGQKITLGNLTWRAATEGDTTNGLSAYVPLAGQQKNSPAFSNSFSVIEFNNTDHTLLDFIMIGINTLILNIKKSKLSEETLNGLKTWLTDNSVVAFVLRATPTDTTITDTELIAQLEAIRTALLQNGTNTITNTAAGSNLAGDMEIGYYGYNPTNRYDKFIWLDINDNYEQIGE